MRPRWKKAINKEIKALEKNETRVTVNLPKEKVEYKTSGYSPLQI